VIKSKQCFEELHGNLDTTRFSLIVGTKRSDIQTRVTFVPAKENAPNVRSLRIPLGSIACDEEDRKFHPCPELNALIQNLHSYHEQCTVPEFEFEIHNVVTLNVTKNSVKHESRRTTMFVITLIRG